MDVGYDGLPTIGTEVPSLRSNVGIDEIVFAMISYKKGNIALEDDERWKGVVSG